MRSSAKSSRRLCRRLQQDVYKRQPGEVWSRERIRAMKEEVEAAGLHVAGIESVNVHDAIKTGAPERDQYIDNYIETLENLGKEDIHLCLLYTSECIISKYELVHKSWEIGCKCRRTKSD